MITLARRSLLARKSSVIAALLTVVFGAALVTATAMINAAQHNHDSAHVTNWQFSAVDAVVKPSAQVVLANGMQQDLPTMPRLTEEQVQAISTAPGVSSVSLERPFPAYAVTDDDQILGNQITRSWGHPWTIAIADGAELTEGSEPVEPSDVVIEDSIAQAGRISVGDHIRVRLADGTQVFTVTGITSRPGSQFEHALFFGNDTATQLAAPVAALVSTSDADALKAALPDMVVAVGDARAQSLQLDPRQAELVGSGGNFLMLVASLALLIAVFVTSSTLSVSITQRRRELAMLRVVGSRSNLIRRMIIWEAILIGICGGIIGAMVGIWLAAAAQDFFVSQNLMARGITVSVDLPALLLGVGSVLLAALVAAVLPARRATRIAPLDALRNAELPATSPNHGRMVWGWICAVGAAVLLVAVFALGGPVTTTRGTIAILLLMMSFPLLISAVWLLGETLLNQIPFLLRPLLERWFGGFIALRSIGSDPRRAAGVAVPITLLVAVSCVLLFQDSANAQAQAKSYAQQLTVDLVIGDTAHVGIPLTVADEVRNLPGVAAVSPRVTSQLVIDQPTTSSVSGTVIGFQPDDVDRLIKLAITEGSWEQFGSNSIGISNAIAENKGWRIGQSVDFLHPDGSSGSAVVGLVFDDPTGLADMVLPVSVLSPHLLEPLAPAIYVKFDDDADAVATRKAVDAVVQQFAPGARALDRDTHLKQVADETSGDDWIVLMVVVILGGYAGISAINVLVGSTMARRREFALLRLAGSRRSQIIGSLMIESLTITLVAGALGTMIESVTMIGYGYLLTDTVWLPFVAPKFWTIIGCAFLAGAVGTLAPSRTAMRADPLEAMS